MINYNYLKDIQRKERTYSSLTKINNHFYEDCSEYFCRLEVECKENLDFRFYNNAMSCYAEIVEKRLNKISRSAYYRVVRLCQVNTLPVVDDLFEPPVNLMDCEKVIFERMISVYGQYYRMIYDFYEDVCVK